MDIARVLKKNKNKLSEQEQIQKASNRMLIFIIIFSGIVLAIDYALVLKFMDIIKNCS